MNVATEPRPLSGRLPMLRGGRVYIWMALFSLAIGALTLLYASTPSYDPWSWLVWGHEVLHGGFHISGGSSWKPLPVIFTTVFGLFGSAQPNLWLIVARAGALLTVLMTCKLTVRVVWGLTLRARNGIGISGLPWMERIAAITPALLAFCIAAVGTGLSRGYPGNMLLGYSEGVMVSCLLIAAERAWDGHHRQAFALGIVGALDRPEFWIIWGPYGLWLMWKDRRAWPLVVGLAVLMLALWLVPQKLGGGTIKGIITHPQHNHSTNSAVNSSFPFWHELRRFVFPLVLTRVEIAAGIQIVLTAGLVWRIRRQGSSWIDAMRVHGAAVGAALAGLVGYAWWFLIALETEVGFAGNPRYAVLGTSLIYVSGAAAYGWGCLGLAQLAGATLVRVKPLQRLLHSPGWSVRVAISTIFMTLVFIFVPSWFTNRLPTIPSIRVSLQYQAELRERVADQIRNAGGANRILTCGGPTNIVMTNDFQVPMVAWYLGVPIKRVESTPPPTRKIKGDGPNVMFQDAASPPALQFPSPQQIAGWEKGGAKYTVTSDPPVTLYLDCSPHGNK
jgi:hypothetical protein